MIERKINYTLIVLDKGKEKDVIEIAEDISVVANTETVKYFFNDTHHIYTFKTDESFEVLKEWSEMILGYQTKGYLLLPYEMTNSSILLPKSIKEHLFDGNEVKVDENDMVEKMNEKLRDEFSYMFKEMPIFDDEDEISKIRNQKRKKSLNEILDKIYDKGMNSISEEEKEILTQISNQ